MVNFGNGVFDFTSNVSGTANVVSGESTGAQYQLAPIDALRNRVAVLEATNTSGVIAHNALPVSYYVFQASGGYYARSSISGHIEFSDPNSIDPVMNSGMAAMISGAINPTSGNYIDLWISGLGGTIFVGPGVHQVRSSIIIQPLTTIQGCGNLATTFQWASGLVVDNANSTIMKSSMWESRHWQASGAVASSGVITLRQRQQHDLGIVLRDFQIDGRRPTISGQLTSTLALPGVASWGHGLALYAWDVDIDNVSVHHCAGAGIILQQYPNTNFGVQSVGHYDFTSDFRLIHSFENAQQGMVIRGLTAIDHYHSYSNGEAGMDVQYCGYYAGIIYATKLQMFQDAVNHGSGGGPTAYDASGFEMRITNNNCQVYDSWIEGPNGPGDNLVLGISGGPSLPPDYTVGGGVSQTTIQNCIFDGMRKAAIYVAPTAVECEIGPVRINGSAPAGESSGQMGVNFAGANFCSLDIYALNLINTPSGQSGYSPALWLGVSGGAQAQSNNIKVRTENCNVAVHWDNVGQQNNTLYINNVCPATNRSQWAFDPFGYVTGINYASNTIKVDGAGLSNASGLGTWRGHNGGIFTASGDAATTTFQISHALYDMPRRMNVTAVLSGQIIGMSGDTSNLYFTYANAPPSGSGKVVVSWWAEVSP